MGQIGPSKIAGTFNGTGAAVYICVGFIPDWVTLYALENAEDYVVYWSNNFRADDRVNGMLWDGDDKDDYSVTPAAGGTALIKPYAGGDTMTSSNQTSTTYGEGVYLVWDSLDLAGTYNSRHTDYRSSGTGNMIEKWTLDTAGSRTGHWNDVCNTTYVGEGSRICIDGWWYTVCALTSNGEAANEVTLNEDAPAGNIEFLGGMFDMVPLATGHVTPPGFYVGNTTVNANNETIMFECGCYDN